MMTLREQLRDPVFREWFAKVPKPHHLVRQTPPWWIYVQAEQDGPWARTSVARYSEGYRYVASHLRDFHDMALSHKVTEFRPPVVRQNGRRRFHFPPHTNEIWCPYCRRMTRFWYFAKHHAMPRHTDPGERRCAVCGVRLSYITRY